MRKTLLQAFDEDFIREVKKARNHPEAFEKASEEFEKKHDFVAFDSYESFRKKKERRHRR